MRADLTPETGARLGKILPRLASNHPGEVMATVAALIRTLDRAGLDLHDLAARMAGPVEPIMHPPARDPADLKAMAVLRVKGAWLESHALDRLTDNQRDFVLKMKRLLQQGRAPTPKQGAYLSDLHAMHGGCDD